MFRVVLCFLAFFAFIILVLVWNKGGISGWWPLSFFIGFLGMVFSVFMSLRDGTKVQENKGP